MGQFGGEEWSWAGKGSVQFDDAWATLFYHNVPRFLLGDAMLSLNQSAMTLNETLLVSAQAHANATHQAPVAAVTLPPDMVRANMAIGVIYPILLGCCTIGNGLNLVVLAKEKNKGSTNSYMIAVAVADIFVLWFFFPDFIWNLSAILKLAYYKDKSNKARTYAFRGIQSWMEETAIQLCDWVLIMFSLERLLAIVKPFSYRELHTARSARIIILLLTFLALLYAVENCVFHFWINSTTTGYTGKEINVALGNIPGWLYRWKTIQDTAVVTIVLAKFFALLVMNVVVILALRRQQKSGIGKQRALQDGNTNRKFRNSNILLLSSVILYLTTQFPSLVANCLILANQYGTYTFSDEAQFLATPITNIFMLTNYSVNFLLYLTVSKRYRDQFMLIFGPIFCPGFLRRFWGNRRRSSGGDALANQSIRSTVTESSNGSSKARANKRLDVAASRSLPFQTTAPSPRMSPEPAAEAEMPRTPQPPPRPSSSLSMQENIPLDLEEEDKMSRDNSEATMLSEEKAEGTEMSDLSTKSKSDQRE